jgi:aminoglycoside phosphotransferase (APT) family kinase protein
MYDSALPHTRLDAFIRAHIPGADTEIKIERIGGGQSNPTFFVDSGRRRMVLRKKPGGNLLPSAHAIEREYRVMRALAATDVPVPDMLLYVDDPDIIGTPFFLMERVDGRVFHSAEIAGVDPASRAAMYKSATETLARLHRVDFARCGLGDFGKTGDYFGRQVRRWTQQWQASKQREIPDVDRLAQWLSGNVPADDRTVICHGDYRIGNLLFHPREPRVVAVLDWELSTLGHPLADLAYLCIPFRTTPNEYGGILGLDHAALGIPSEQDIVGYYSAVSGRAETMLPFHLGFALFRFAVIFAGIEARAAEGNASNPNAGSVGKLAADFARRGREVLGI